MGWFSNFFKAARAIALPVIAVFAPELIPAIGTSLGATTPAAATALGTATISGGTTLLAGGSPEQAAKSAVLAGAGSYAGSTAADVLGDSATPAVTKSAISGGASSATQAALQGKDPLSAGLKGAVTSAGSEYVAGLAGQPGSAAYDIAKFGAGQTLSNVLGDKTTSAPTSVTSTPTSVTTTGVGTTPGSSALAQALRTDLGAPIFGSDKDKEGKKSGWNVESLRYMNSGEA